MSDPNDGEDRVPGLDRLDLSREPSHDLWPGIEARIAPRRRSGVATWAAAACLVAALGTIIGVAVLQTPATVAPASVVASRDGWPHRALPARSDADPMHTLVKANLQIVADAEKQLERAIAADPDSGYLQNLLLATRQQRRALDERLSRPT